MNNLLLANLVILIPFIGAFVSLIFSQLEDHIAHEGKTRDWLVIILILLPTTIISLLFIFNLHIDDTYYIEWIPGLLLGLRVNELSKVFAIFVVIASTILAIYSTAFMKDDRSRTSFWFFLLLSLSGLLLGIFANNLYWMFLGFEIASVCGFFLIAHYYRKSGEEGIKAGKTGIRFLIFNFLGDVLLIIAIALLVKAFGSPVFVDIEKNWIRRPELLIGGSSSNTRLIIAIFLVLGALVKSGQFPFLFWPLTGKKLDTDLEKTPIPISTYLLPITFGSMGLYILSIFHSLFSNKGLEVFYGTPLFNEIPFILIGWSALLVLLISIGVIVSTDSLNRVVAGASLAQLSLSYLSLSSANEIGELASFVHLISSAPATLALAITFGMFIESLRMRKISRVSGLGNKFLILKIMGIISVLSYIGIFPLGTYFSRDMIFYAMKNSIVSSMNALLIIAIIGIVLLTFGVSKVLMKTLFGTLDEELSVRNVSLISLISQGAFLFWAITAGIVATFWRYPEIRSSNGYFGYYLTLEYDFPIFSDWVISPIILTLLPIIFGITYYLYRDGIGLFFKKIRETKVIIWTKRILENIFYYDQIYNYLLLKPLDFLSKYFSWTRLKAPAAIVIWAVLSVVILVSLLFITGGM